MAKLTKIYGFTIFLNECDITSQSGMGSRGSGVKRDVSGGHDYKPPHSYGDVDKQVSNYSPCLSVISITFEAYRLTVIAY